MREIIDKHFFDNWVIAYYLGYVVGFHSSLFYNFVYLEKIYYFY